MIGDEIYDLAVKLYPINRSLTGDGVRQTLEILKGIVPELHVKEIATDAECFDWKVPKEWNAHDAYVKDSSGKKVIDFQKHNLHLMGYSEPIHTKMSLDELQKYLYSIPDYPEAIPYVTSYYKRGWGFCLAHEEREKLQDGEYEVYIDSELKEGSLTYGEILIKGESEKEILLSTYICHPSMANNELSGPTVSIHLVKWLKELPRRYSYRIIFVPETIGSICYLSRHYKEMKKNIIAGFVLTCIGDEGDYSYLASIEGDTLADEVAQHILSHIDKDYKKYSFLQRGSDERQYCSPGIDLPVVDLMRTKYGHYKEYHTSKDDLSVISPKGLEGGYEMVKKVLEALENNYVYKTTVLCEPQLGKRGLYPTQYFKSPGEYVFMMRNVIAYSNGKRTLLEIAQKINKPIWELQGIVQRLMEENILLCVGD
jgi:aminopeptidase-like protein